MRVGRERHSYQPLLHASTNQPGETSNRWTIYVWMYFSPLMSVTTATQLMACHTFGQDWRGISKGCYAEYLSLLKRWKEKIRNGAVRIKYSASNRREQICWIYSHDKKEDKTPTQPFVCHFLLLGAESKTSLCASVLPVEKPVDIFTL